MASAAPIDPVSAAPCLTTALHVLTSIPVAPRFRFVESNLHYIIVEAWSRNVSLRLLQVTIEHSYFGSLSLAIRTTWPVQSLQEHGLDARHESTLHILLFFLNPFDEKMQKNQQASFDHRHSIAWKIWSNDSTDLALTRSKGHQKRDRTNTSNTPELSWRMHPQYLTDFPIKYIYKGVLTNHNLDCHLP